MAQNAATWSPSQISATVPSGTVQVTEATLSVSSAVTNVHISVVPELAPFVTVSPSSFSGIGAGESRTIAVFIAIPKVTKANPKGTIHLSARDRTGRTFGRPLPVSIRVTQPSLWTIPDVLTVPSPDRVVTEPDLRGIQFVSDEVNIYFKEGTTKDIVTGVVASIGGVFLGGIPELGMYQVRVQTNSFDGISSLIGLLQLQSSVDFGTHTVLSDSFVIPNDPGTSMSYVPGMLNLQKAWDIVSNARDEVGSTEFDVAVVDSVFDKDNPDLQPNIANLVRNLGPLTVNHGTRVASIIGAAGNNGLGIAGVMWKGRLRLFSAADPFNPLKWSSFNKAITDAVTLRPRILNFSGGLECKEEPCTSKEESALKDMDLQFARLIGSAHKLSPPADILWVISAGNAGIHVSNSSPARLSGLLPNVMSVSAVDSNGHLAIPFTCNGHQQGGSDYGPEVSVAAPGVNVTSDVIGDGANDGTTNNGCDATGTSFAAPHVTGVAGLLMSLKPDLTADDLKRIIERSANQTGEDPDSNKVKLLDACRAVKSAAIVDDPPAPQLLAPLNLTAIAPKNGVIPCQGLGYDVEFSWSDVSADSCNSIDHYEFRLYPPTTDTQSIDTNVNDTTFSYRICAPAPTGQWTWSVTARDKYDNRSDDVVRIFSFEPTVIIPPPDVSITKTASPNPLASGGIITYTITVQNAAGTTDAQNVTVTDPLDSRLTYQSCSTSTGGACSPKDGVPTALFPILVGGIPATFTIAATAPTVTTSTQISNTATATADNEPSGNTANNQASSIVTINTSSALPIGGPFAGHVTALESDPSNPATLYAFDGAENTNAASTLFKSTDGGQSWKQLLNFGKDNTWPFRFPGGLKLDPKNPGTVYAGYQKSIDAGLTWTDNKCVILGIDPVNTATIYGTACGPYRWQNDSANHLFKSTDGGQNWNLIYSSPAAVMIFVVVDPMDPSTIYALPWTASVLKSTDAGQTWVTLSLPTYVPTSLAIDPKTPSTLYAGHLKSADGGQTWTTLSCYLLGMVIDPVNTSTLYGAGYGGVWKSTDGGQSCALAVSGLTSTYVTALTIDSVNPNTLYAGTNGSGIFKTADGGQHWNTSSSGFTNTNVFSLAINPVNPSILYAGLSHGAMFRTADGGQSWGALDYFPWSADAPLSFVVIDPVTPTTLYSKFAEPTASTDSGRTWQSLPLNVGGNDLIGFSIDPSNHSTLYAAVLDTHTFHLLDIFKSTDAGFHWTSTNASVLKSSTTFRTKIFIDPKNSLNMYALLDSGLFKTADGGQNWIPTNNGMSGIMWSFAIDPLDSATLYGGNDSSGFFKSTDTGSNWVAIGHLPNDIRQLVVDPMQTSVIYGVGSSVITKTTDGGQTWNDLTGGLRDFGGITAFVLDPINSSTLYTATIYGGVFKSTDGGQTWQPTGAN
ncbi:MAG: S8 family serine peptidase [Terriglobia bacterium]|nr:S8 family serine peptidase [Terriglobia bacterium]